MKEEIIPFANKVREIITDSFLPVFFRTIDNQIDFIEKCEQVFNKHINKLQSELSERSLHKNKLIYHNEFYETIREKNIERGGKNFDSYFSSFTENCNSFFDTVEESVIRLQDEERFIANNTDGFFLRIFKNFKSAFFFISKIPVITANLFRKLIRKPQREKQRWNHKIPLRNLTSYILRDLFCLSVLDIIREVNKRISKTYLEVWKRDEEIGEFNPENKIPVIDLGGEITELQNYKNEIAHLVERAFEEKIREFENAFSKVGTIELFNIRYRSNKVIRLHDTLNEEYEKINKNWSNTYFAIFEDWRMNKELYILIEKIYGNYKDVLSTFNDITKNKIKSKLKDIKDFLNNITQRFNSFSGNNVEAKELLVNEKNKIFKELTKNFIPSTSELILSQNIPDLIDVIEYKVNKGVDELPDKRAIVKSISYDEGLRNSELDYISPKEIITYSAISFFTKSCKEIKNSLMLNIEDIQKELKEVDQIADFNLESAISMYKTEDILENPVKIAEEGIKRANSKTESIEIKIDEIGTQINEELKKAVEKINDQLIKLNQTENIFDIKLKIVKSKAVQRTEELKQKTLYLVKNFIPVFISSAKKVFNKSEGLLKYIRNKFGLIHPPTSISSEVSDFLAETEKAISKLPFVYQRLFRIEPLEDERFFEGRVKELEKISSAFNNWEHKKFAPVIVFGEKGSGITTLLNFFFRTANTSYPLKRTSVKSKIYTEEKFVNFFRDLLDNEELKTYNDIISYLNNTERLIIAIENLQNLFLKKVGGFTCLKMLFEVISKTNKNVFWIITSNFYSWEYLSKVMDISDYFGYKVQLEQLDNKLMIDIILKRHRISGYNIYFEPENPELIKRKYKKLTEKEIQNILIEEFFSELNKFAKSNISLALLYWMRSTKKVTSSLITLSSLHELTTFPGVINQEKIFVLYLLLLHDGLSEEEVALIYDKHPNEIRLILLTLFDDGIIVKRENLFIINPLLYRQIIFLLQSKNIIH